MTSQRKTYRKIYLVTFVAALAGLLFGLDLGVISGALPFMSQELSLTISQQGWIASSVLFGAAFGAIISAAGSNWFGRRNCLIGSAFLFAVMSVYAAHTPDYRFLVNVRFLLGVSVGLATYNAPLYLAEIAPVSVRGALITFYQLMITIGIVLAFLSDLYFTPTGNWRMMLGIIAAPAIVMLGLLLFLPKSPRWLMLKGEHQKAKVVLNQFHHASEAQKEVDELEKTLKKRQTLKQILREKPFRLLLVLAVVLQMIQQFSGMNAMLYFAPEIFSKAGFVGHQSQMWATLGIGLINVVTTIFAIRLIDRLGRRTLLYLSGSLIFISTLAMVVLFFLFSPTQAWVPYCSLAAVFVFIIGYALGFAPVVWTLCAEIFPLQGRSFGMACATTANWVFSGLVGLITLPLIHAWGVGGFYLALCVFSLFSLIFIRFWVPETKGISLEAITEHVWSRQPLRYIGRMNRSK